MTDYKREPDDESSTQDWNRRLKDAMGEVEALGGWGAFTSGGWLLRLIQRSFAAYFAKADPDYLRQKYPGKSDEFISRKLISIAARNALLVGGLTGAVVSADEIVAIATGGEVGIGLPANIALAMGAACSEAVVLLRIQLKLVASLAKLQGIVLDLDDPEDVLTVLAFALGGGVAEVAGKAGMRVGGRMAATGVRKVVSGEVLQAVKAFGARLGVKILQRTIAKYAVPVASVGIGSVWNYTTTRAVGRIAQAHFTGLKQAPLS